MYTSMQAAMCTARRTRNKTDTSTPQIQREERHNARMPKRKKKERKPKRGWTDDRRKTGKKKGQTVRHRLFPKTNKVRTKLSGTQAQSLRGRRKEKKEKNKRRTGEITRERTKNSGGETSWLGAKNVKLKPKENWDGTKACGKDKVYKRWDVVAQWKYNKETISTENSGPNGQKRVNLSGGWTGG